ncbi:MAG: carbohydrate binding domain-containing protein [Myxococcaceae bacterium]
MRLAATASLALLVACGPPPDECSASRPCAAGSSCRAGRCEAADAGGGNADPCAENPAQTPRNLIYNPGFECGDPPAGWFAQNGQLSVVRNSPLSGTSVARLSDWNSVSTPRLWLDTPYAINAPGTKTYCIRAWMRGSSVGQLTVRKVATGGGGTDDLYSSPLTANWVVVPPPTYGAMKITGQNEKQFLIGVSIPNSPKASDWLEMDDVQLWESTSGDCHSR